MAISLGAMMFATLLLTITLHLAVPPGQQATDADMQQAQQITTDALHWWQAHAPFPPPAVVVAPDVVVLGDVDTGLGGAQDRSGRTYIDRVSCEMTAADARVSLEPLANDTAMTRIGALG